MDEIIFRLRRTSNEIPGAINVNIRNKLRSAHLISFGNDHNDPEPAIKPSNETVKSVRNKQYVGINKGIKTQEIIFAMTFIKAAFSNVQREYSIALCI